MSPRWVARLSAVLLGWNVALISAFLFVIATFVLLRKSGVSFQALNIGAWFLGSVFYSPFSWVFSSEKLPTLGFREDRRDLRTCSFLFLSL